MLLTMPVLFAFYSLLSQAIELRGADFGIWIHDLSAKDPYFLYAAGNVGSLLALLAYPLLLEPNLSTSAQSRLWSVGYAAFVVLTAAGFFTGGWIGSTIEEGQNANRNTPAAA